MQHQQTNVKVRGSVHRALAGSVATLASIGYSTIFGIVFPLVALRFWTADQYGSWAVVFAMSSLFSVFDYAHQTYIGNLYTVMVNRGQKDAAMEIMSTACRWTFVVAAGKCCLIIGYGLIIDYSSAFILALPLLMAQVASSGLLGMVIQVFRPHGYYARAVYMQTSWQIAATIISLYLIILFDAGTGTAVIAFALVKLIAESIIILYSINFFSIKLLKRQSKDNGGLNFCRSFPYLLSTALDYGVLYGSVVALERWAGTTQVGLYTTVRTLGNAIIQNMTFLLWPVAHDFVRMKESQDRVGLQAMFGFAWLATGLVAIPVSVGLILFGDSFFQIWTKHKFGTSVPVLGFLTGAAFFRMLSLPPWTYYQQFNKTSLLVKISAMRFIVFFALALINKATPANFALAALSSEIAATTYLCFQLIVDKELVEYKIGLRIMLPCFIGIAWLAGCLVITLGPTLWMALLALIGGGVCTLWGWNALEPATHSRIRQNVNRLIPGFVHKRLC